MNHTDTLAADALVPQNDPQSAHDQTLDALRRRPRPLLAWEQQQYDRNFRVLRTPGDLLGAAANDNDANGWIARGSL
ncbi:hypothetical protein [Solimonas marina]|uniref:Uncharacterized protein n=1 Tax=Solimonas marina TaxID=2714601 RepID=A0A969WEE7_9GAMM|nr:hypothetical protein [Solimonas marina]NKF24595.1 hypothetical protein [Solimonas marina]